MSQCVNCAGSTNQSTANTLGCFSPIESGCFSLKIVQGETFVLPLCFLSKYSNLRCLVKAGGITLPGDLGFAATEYAKIVCSPAGYKTDGLRNVSAVSADGLSVTFGAPPAMAPVNTLVAALPIVADQCFDSVSSNVIGCAAGAANVTQPVAIRHVSPKNWLLDGAIYRDIPTSDSRQDIGVNYNGTTFYHVFEQNTIVVGDSIRIPSAGIVSPALVDRVWSQQNASYNASEGTSPTNPKMLWFFSLAGGVSSTGSGCAPAVIEAGAMARFKFALNANDCWDMVLEACQTAKLTYDSSQLIDDGCGSMAAQLGRFSVFATIPTLASGKLKLIRKRVFDGSVLLESSSDGIFVA